MVVSWWSYSTPLWYAQHRRGPAAGYLHRRRPDPPRRRAWAADRRDRRQPRGPARLRDARRTRREVAELLARYEIDQLTSQEDGLLIHVLARRAVPHDHRGHARDGHRPAPRVARLSYFFPAHNEEANLEGLVDEALATLPLLAETFEIIAVDDGSRDATPAIADELAARHPGVVRVVHHPTNLGYGAALRSGFAAARYELVAFTDGDRQFQVADIGRLDRAPVRGRRARRRRRLPDQARRPGHPHRLRAGLPARQPDLLRAQGHRRRLRLQALPPRGPRGHPRRVGRCVLLGRAADQARVRRVGTIAEVGVPHYPRTAGSRDRRQAVGHPPGGPRLLAPAPVHVGEPRRGLAPSRPARVLRPTDGAGQLSRRLSPPGSTSSELTKSRKTSSRGSTSPSPGRLERHAGLALVVVEARRRPRAPACSSTAAAAKIRTPARTASASASEGRASTSTVRPTPLEDQPGVERLLGEVGDDRPGRRHAQVLEGRGEQVVGERPLRGQALELHGDRARLPRADPDREVAVAPGLLEDHDMAVRQHVDAHALDDHLDQLVVGHAPDYPTVAGAAGRPGPRPSVITRRATSAPATKPPM